MRIDVTRIEGYADMTPEEKVAALEAIDYDVPEPDYTGYVPKDQLDKVASEAAEWRRKHNALLTEEEQKNIAREEEMESLRKTVEEMEKEKTITEIKSNYIAIGYEEELAEDTAKATVEGDNKKIFQNHKKFLEAHDKAFESSLLSKTPRPGEGVSRTSQPMTKEEIVAIKDPELRKQKIGENPEMFGIERS